MRRFPIIALFAFILLASPFALAQSAHPAAADDQRSAAEAFEAGQGAQQRGEMNSAVAYYTKAISLAPALYQPYYQRATALMSLGRTTEAEADLKKVIEMKPDFARAHRAYGVILLDNGKTDDAKREFARAIEIDPKLTGIRLNYGSAFIKSGEPAKAIEQLRAAIELGETSPLGYALLGLAEERTGKTADALADYSRAIEMESANAVAREGRARLLEARGETAKAIEDYAIAYRAQPSPDTALRLANLYTRAGQPQAALQIYRVMIAQRPNDLAMRTEIARLMAESGDAEGAMKEITGLVTLRPTDARLLMAAGDIYFQDKPGDAANYYRKALEIDAANNRARVQLGASLVRSNQCETALPVLTEALAREADNYAAHANLATAYFKLQRYVEAANQFIWLIRSKPETSASYFFLAISLDHLGDCQQALRAYQEFVRRADPAASKNEIDDANIKISLLQRLVKEGKCKTLVKGKGK